MGRILTFRPTTGAAAGSPRPPGPAGAEEAEISRLGALADLASTLLRLSQLGRRGTVPEAAMAEGRDIIRALAAVDCLRSGDRSQENTDRDLERLYALADRLVRFRASLAAALEREAP